MKGIVKIEAHGDHNCVITMDMEGMTNQDKLVIFDGLIDVFQLDEQGKRVIGTMIALGGLGAVIGKAPTKIKVDMDQFNGLKNKKEKQNETDAL